VKTAGTSWLEALRVIAVREPALYRKIHQRALDSYEEALTFYHITADVRKVPPLESVSDNALSDYLNHPEARQVLHITYGTVLQDTALRSAVYKALATHEELHYAFVSKHIRKHVALLGRPTKDGKHLMSVQDYTARYGALQKTWAEIVADSVLAAYPDPKDLHDYHPGRWVYQNGLFINALFALWQKTKRQEYFHYIVKWVDLFIDEDGVFDTQTYTPGAYVLDSILPGRVLIALYNETRQDKYRNAAQALIEQLRTQPRTSDGGYWHKQIYPNQMWLDGIYMADLFSVEFARTFGQPEWFDEAVHQITLIHQHTHDPETGLLYHGWDETKTRIWAHPERGTSPEFWGRAVGWYVMALVDCLEVLPKDHRGRGGVLSILRSLAAGLARYQHPDTGAWYQVLDKREQADNWPETSCTVMIATAFAKGVRLGFLDPSYQARAQHAYRYVVEQCVHFDQDGQCYLTGIVTVGSLRENADYNYYVTSQQRTNDFKGIGAFLYASLEIP
jgi:unsaturated rhamnogalacturonyl hydrolase